MQCKILSTLVANHARSSRKEAKSCRRWLHFRYFLAMFCPFLIDFFGCELLLDEVEQFDLVGRAGAASLVAVLVAAVVKGPVVEAAHFHLQSNLKRSPPNSDHLSTTSTILGLFLIFKLCKNAMGKYVLLIKFNISVSQS
jgi:hypothetical protein